MFQEQEYAAKAKELRHELRTLRVKAASRRRKQAQLDEERRDKGTPCWWCMPTNDSTWPPCPEHQVQRRQRLQSELDSELVKVQLVVKRLLAIPTRRMMEHIAGSELFVWLHLGPVLGKTHWVSIAQVHVPRVHSE